MTISFFKNLMTEHRVAKCLYRQNKKWEAVGEIARKWHRLGNAQKHTSTASPRTQTWLYYTLNANPRCIYRTLRQGISLGVPAIGDWSRALNSFANEGVTHIRVSQEKHADDPAEVQVQVMLGRPSGGCSVGKGKYNNPWR